MTLPSRQLLGAASAIVLALGLAACSPVIPGAETPQNPAPNDEAANDTGHDNDGNEGNDGRAFDSTNDAVITSLSSALKADDFQWEGSTIKIYFHERSVESVTAAIGCTAANAIIADSETAIMVFPDGEVDCSVAR